MLKNPPANGLIPGSGNIPGGNGNPLQYPCLENSMDRESLAGYNLQDHKELDTTEQLSMTEGIHQNQREVTVSQYFMDFWWSQFVPVPSSPSWMEKLSSRDPATSSTCLPPLPGARL